MSAAATNGASGTELTQAALDRSRRKSRILVAIILGGPLALFLLSGVRAVQLAKEGDVPVEWRDLNCDGKVSAAEWLRGGIDFRVRPSALLQGCQDVYAVKGGTPVVVRCAEPPVCRLARDLVAQPPQQ